MWKVKSQTLFYLFIYLFILHLNIQFLQHHLLKEFYFLHCIVFGSFSKISWLYLCGTISVSTLCLIVLFIYPFTKCCNESPCLSDCCFTVSFEVRYHLPPPNFVLWLVILFFFLLFFYFYGRGLEYNFKFYFQGTCKIT